MHARLVRAVRKALRAAADPAKAPAMQAYMKSEMPYLGIQTPLQRKTTKAVFAAHPIDSFEPWRDAVLELWRGARYREERYAAIELTGVARYRKFRTLAALPVYEEMITTGAWWDYVDAIASNRVGELLRLYPAKMGATLRKWAVSDDMWKRRSAILAQLRSKAGTDVTLLQDCIRPSMDSKEFFLRKGIGWALREYARTDAGYVVRFVREHEDRLSGLTKREALKHALQTTPRRRGSARGSVRAPPTAASRRSGITSTRARCGVGFSLRRTSVRPSTGETIMSRAGSSLPHTEWNIS